MPISGLFAWWQTRRMQRYRLFRARVAAVAGNKAAAAGIGGHTYAAVDGKAPIVPS